MSEGETRPSPSAGGGPDFAAGAEFAGHRIEAEVGRGGMGVVYRARHLALDRERALKVVTPGLSADPRFRERFRRESRLAAAIEHPNVITVHHAGEEGGRLYIAMHLVDGTDLQREVAARGPLDPARAAELIAQAAAALDAAHAAGLVHRDVKPANVLIEGAAGSERVLLTDFGISRVSGAGGTVTSAGEVLGSPDYIAPEQAEAGTADSRSDVYSLGAVLHFALTGHPPFEREGDMAKLYAHGHAPRPRTSQEAPWLPEAVDAVIAKALAVHPAERYANAGSLAEDARQALAGAGSPPPSAGLPATGPESRAEPDTGPTRNLRRRRLLVGGAIALALLAAGGVVALIAGGGDEGVGSQNPSVPQPKVVATIPVGAGPTGITVDASGVWVTSRDADALYRVDAATEKSAKVPVALGGAPRSVAAGFGSIWAVVGGGDEVVRFDPNHPGGATSIPVGAGPADVAVGDRYVWVANGTDDSVSRIDPETDSVDATVPVGSGPRAIATGEAAVWVANINDGTISKIDPITARTVGRPVAAGQRPSDVAAGAGTVWAMDNFNGSVTRIDPDSLAVLGDPIEVGAKPRGIKVGLGYVWVANGGEDSVSRLDTESGEPVGSPVPVGDDPADLAIGRGSVWTADFAGATATRIEPG